MMPTHGMEKHILCPFFVQYNKHIRGNMITLTCEPLDDNMGFDMSLKTAFATEGERRDYMELFCADRYESCPMFQAIKRKYDKREEREKCQRKRK